MTEEPLFFQIHPKLTPNKELQLDSSQDPYTANLQAKVNIFYVSATQK